MTGPRVLVVQASLPSACTVCCGDREVLQVQRGDDGGWMIPCPHCTFLRPLPIVDVLREAS